MCRVLEFSDMVFLFVLHVSADEVGPPGMVFVAPQGVHYPVDAVWVKPALVKQLERKQVCLPFFHLVYLTFWPANLVQC